ncbi:CTP synthetase [Roseovarius aquimarinus]|uniref:CTP synthetase n=1 Tax=Roseovarius aquimarinus TaxID=1229156 RepID=A0ABW7I3B8_9RHOB
MWLLASFLNIIVGTSLAGIGVIIALVAGFDDMQGVAIAAAIGFALAMPVTWGVMRQITARGAAQRN